MFSTCFKQQYSKRTLAADWHKDREAEPKDYDPNLCPDGKKDLRKSTYKDFGTSLDADWTTTTQAQMRQYLLKKECDPRETLQSAVETDLFRSSDVDRHSLIRWDTTYGGDYLSACDRSMEPARTTVAPLEDTPDFRRRLSQFTDTAGHRRVGHNKFQDESGVYATLGNRTSINTQITNPICPQDPYRG